jgi:hypothetical protein
MGYDDRREILERLEALERVIRSRHDDRRGGEHERRGRRRHHHDDCDGDRHRGDDRHEHGGGRESDEKRIIDTIVRLVTERVGRMIESRQEGSRHDDEGWDEKRIVDLVVGLVAEKVQEIVSTELDRRFDRSDVAASPPPSPAGGPSGSEEC